MMTHKNFDALTGDIIDIAVEAGKILTKQHDTHNDIIAKDGLAVSNDFATEADFLSQNFILNRLRELRPEDRIVAEETDSTNHTRNHTEKHELVWHVDPLDGTVNYSRGFECYAVSIAACDALTGEPVIGVVHAPALNLTYYTYGSKSFIKNGVTGNVKQLTIVNHSTAPVLSAGVPYKREQQATLFAVLPQIMDHYGSSRDLGACSLNLCFFAEGRFDATMEVTVKTWDYLAGMVIARNAGLIVSAIPNKLFGGYTIFGAQTIEAHAMLEGHMLQVAGYSLP